MAELLDDWLADLGGGLATVRDTLAAAAGLLVLQAPLLAVEFARNKGEGARSAT